MKHIARRHFFVRECVENLMLRVPYVNTVDNEADLFTKVLAPRVFYPLRDAVMNVSREDSLRCGGASDSSGGPRPGSRPAP